MTKITNLFKILFEFSKSTSFKTIFQGWFKPFTYLSILKFRIMILFFIFIYTIFFGILLYILYKSYLITLSKLNEFVYGSMAHEISRLNWKIPISNYVELAKPAQV